jgi:predicted peptidase
MAQSAHILRKKVSRTLKLDYLLSLPDDYESGRHWPLMLFLHGMGERADHPLGLLALKKHGPPKRFDQHNPTPFIIASPQCPADSWWSEHVDTLLGLLDELQANYPVDPARVYLTGLSMGGYGTWTLCAHHPERFAAAVPICGGLPHYIDLDRAVEKMKPLPIWTFHGAKDAVVPLEETERVVKALKAAGGHIKFTVYRAAQHDSWTKTYNNPKVYEWLLQHTRNA